MNTIFKGIVGSKAYGLDNEYSDTDIRGIYQQTNDEVLGFNYQERIDISADEVYYEIRKFIELIGKSNPTILEMLWLPEPMILKTSNAFEYLSSYRHKFLTKQCKQSYIGYACAQIKKTKINRNAKNLMHALRLVMAAEKIVKEQEILVKLESDQIILCKEIRQGIIDFNDVVLLAESKIKYVEVLFENCSLPEKINIDLLNDLLVSIRNYNK